jgi:segregation and condensation protein A|tara:strand:- start:4447 stop:5244 length:798 start_codon:yes stop_codon:yes gene_type:complete
MEEEKEEVKDNEEITVKQDQIHDLLFSKEIGWQDVIYDLINTDQLDPWDIDITLLANRYLEKIQKLEEQNFFISSKVLLAAALLLRIKSEILLNEYIKSIDEILFGKKEKEPLRINERIELEGEIPELIPKSPLPRFRKVTLKELVDSLGKAIITENRRIRREVTEKDSLRENTFTIHKRKFNIQDKIKDVYGKVLEHLKEEEKIHFDKIKGETKEEKILSFSSLIHLESQNKVWIEQNEHFGDVHIWIKKTYLRNNDPFEGLRD